MADFIGSFEIIKLQEPLAFPLQFAHIHTQKWNKFRFKIRNGSNERVKSLPIHRKLSSSITIYISSSSELKNISRTQQTFPATTASIDSVHRAANPLGLQPLIRTQDFSQKLPFGKIIPRFLLLSLSPTSNPSTERGEEN